MPFCANPSRPAYKPPPGAVDAHCHVFGPADVFPYAPERKYTPCDAPKEKLFALRDFLGFSRNVIVQATCHGADNRALVDALKAPTGSRAASRRCGRSSASDELKALDEAGVRGVRFNFVKRLVDATPRDVYLGIAERIAALGWHIVVYFEAHELADLIPFLNSSADDDRRRPHGPAGSRQGRRSPRLPPLRRPDGRQPAHLEQGHLPGAPVDFGAARLRRLRSLRAGARSPLSPIACCGAPTGRIPT